MGLLLTIPMEIGVPVRGYSGLKSPLTPNLVSACSGTGTTDPGTDPTGTPNACDGVAAWSSSAVYTGGQTAIYNGHLWKAKW